MAVMCGLTACSIQARSQSGDACRKVSGMVSEIAKDVNTDLLNSADTVAGAPEARLVQDCLAAELRPWFEPAPLADVQQMFAAASDPQTQAELAQFVPAPVLEYLGLVA